MSEPTKAHAAATTSKLVHSADFADALRARRDHFNLLFASARHQYGSIDAEAFKSFLLDTVEPLVVEATRRDAARIPELVQVCYEVGLDLVGQKLLGRGARTPHIERAYQKLLPAYASLAAEAPFRVLAVLGNATHHLATEGANADFFIEEMLRCSPLVPDLSALHSLGQVLGWRAGLAHFRDGALHALSQLGEALARAALSVPDDMLLGEARRRLHEDLWFDPRRGAVGPTWLGGFRGFGGLFVAPPLVTTSAGLPFVTSRASSWLVMTDAFGTTLHRATDSELEGLEAPGTKARASTKNDALIVEGQKLDVVPRGEVTSSVSTEQSTFVTFSMSHSVLVVPRRSS